MESSFTEQQRQTIQELVGLPPKLTRGSTPARRSVPIDDIRRILGLSKPRNLDMVTADCWLAGGTPLRWICKAESGGDIDLYFPSADVVNKTARSLLAGGCSFRCFRAWKIICQLCGRPGEVVRSGNAPQGSYFPCIRCGVCGELGPEDYGRITADRLLELTPKLISWSRMLAVEMATPLGEIIHLSTIVLKPTPQAIISGFDFSIVQFAFAHGELHFGAHAWTDLLTNRLRIENCNQPTYNFYRMRKYANAGFKPYGSTRFRVTLRHLLANMPRHLLRR